MAYEVLALTAVRDTQCWKDFAFRSLNIFRSDLDVGRWGGLRRNFSLHPSEPNSDLVLYIFKRPNADALVVSCTVTSSVKESFYVHLNVPRLGILFCQQFLSLKQDLMDCLWPHAGCIEP